MGAEYGFQPVRTIVGGVPTLLSDRAPLTAATVIEMFELCKNVVGTGISALGAINIDGTDPLFVAAKASAATSAFTEMPIYGGSGVIFKVAVKELVAGTVLTATGGGATTFVDSTLVIADGTYGNNLLKGSVIEVDTCAAANAADGDQITLTGYTAATGTLTHASTGTFAAGDTVHFVKLGTSIFSAYSLGLEYSGSASTDGCRLVLDGGAGTSRFFRVIGWNDARTWLLGFIIASPDQAIAVQDT